MESKNDESSFEPSFLNIYKKIQQQFYLQSQHYSQKYFKEPTKFRPQRWESECNNLPLYVYGGFGGGARTCIGKHLALLETKIAFVKFMKRYKQINYIICEIVQNVVQVCLPSSQI